MVSYHWKWDVEILYQTDATHLNCYALFKKAGVSNVNIEPENAFVLFGSLKGCGILNAQIELRKCVCIVWQFLIEREFQNADKFQKKILSVGKSLSIGKS